VSTLRSVLFFIYTIPRRLAILLVRFYQYVLKPMMAMFGGRCRFYPTCSNYAIGALKRHGLIKAIPMIVWRLLRCQPWGGMGHDPVPNSWDDFIHPKR